MPGATASIKGIAGSDDLTPDSSRQRADVRPPERTPSPTSPTGVLHAKAVIADHRWVFITSANLTAAAWDQNIELGLLTDDRPLATQVVRHFEALIEHRAIHRLP